MSNLKPAATTEKGAQPEAENTTSGKPLSSLLDCTPHTHSSPIYLDAVCILNALTSVHGQSVTVNLPDDLARIFGIKTASLLPSGRIYLKKGIETNGTHLDRTTLGLPTPKVSNVLLNQIQVEEAQIWLRHSGDPKPYQRQVSDLLEAYRKLFKFLEASFGRIDFDAQRIIRLEIYREYSILGDEYELQEQVRRLLGRKYGHTRLRDEGNVGDLGDAIAFIIPTVGISKSYVKKQHFGVKLYRKGNRLRIEAEFQNFPVPGFSQRIKGLLKPDDAVDLIGRYIDELSQFAESVLNDIHQNLFKVAPVVNVGHLQQKLKSDLKFKNVTTNLAMLTFARSLAEKGYYCKTEHPEDLRLSYQQIGKLIHPVSGIAEVIKHAGASKRFRQCLRLKDNWELTPPIGKSAKASRGDLISTTIESIKAEMPLSPEVEAVVRRALESTLTRK